MTAMGERVGEGGEMHISRRIKRKGGVALMRMGVGVRVRMGVLGMERVGMGV